ncbi:MAG TPA: 4-alpha-glucanotransferase, partial [Chitinophagaceae bacterium]|nr:4-alpha-glucanotransferase [Chitinophagaceae bacterium]
MTIKFYLRYYTHFGQTLWISGNTEELGNDDPAKAIPMTWLNNENWYCILDIKKKKLRSQLRYRYFLKQGDGEISWDGEKQRVIGELPNKCREIQIVDTWNAAGEYENVFFTAAFRDVFFASRTGAKGLRQSPGKDSTHLFKVKAPTLDKNEVVCLLGSGLSLGYWSTEKPILLEKKGDWWTAQVDLSREGFPAAYKYGVYNSKKNSFIQYEEGENRIIHSESARNKITVLHDGFVHLSNTNWKAAGIAIPVFSLKSRNSFGVGEFSDLKLMVDWARSVGMKLIQLLPVNDTTSSRAWTDSYPYSAISSFALHPIYINLSKLAGKLHAGKLLPFKEQQKHLNALTGLDYEQVMKLKIGILKDLYELMSRDCFESEDYKMFFIQNKAWLQPYAAYSFFRDQYGSSDF